MQAAAAGYGNISFLCQKSRQMGANFEFNELILT